MYICTMEVKVNIPDKEYQKIDDFCQMNNIDIKSYLSDALLKGFNIDRFGDLNKPVDKIEVIKEPLIKEVKMMENKQGFIIVYDNGKTTDVLWDEVTAVPIQDPPMIMLGKPDWVSEKGETIIEKKQEQQTVKRNRRQIQSK